MCERRSRDIFRSTLRWFQQFFIFNSNPCSRVLFRVEYIAVGVSCPNRISRTLPFSLSRAHGVTEAMWRSGEALRPYFQDVLQLLRKLRELKAADPRAVPAISAPDATDFVHFPIVDCNVADDTKVSDVVIDQFADKDISSSVPLTTFVLNLQFYTR